MTTRPRNDEAWHRYGATLLAVVAVLVVPTTTVVLVRAASVSDVPAPDPRLHIPVDADRVARHLSGALRFPTIASADGVANTAEFTRFHDYLLATYPLTHARLVRETVNGTSLLYEWKGRDRAHAPIVLMGHIDVVPAGPAPETRWTRPPFGGTISDGFVYGRGALDDKGAVIAILDAVEQLLQQGFSPSRTIYLAFGADEEVGGEHGARAIVRVLQERGVGEPALVLDEGGALIAGQVPGVAGPAAMIGIAEKGYLTLELSATGPSGHSSTPLVPTQIGRLSAAIARLEAHPFPGRLEAPTLEMLRAITPAQPFGRRLVLANLWLFGPLVRRQLLSSSDMATMVHTTTAPTVFNAGEVENVLPANARALVNLQLLTGDSIEAVVARVKKTIADPAIEVRPLPVGFATDPSPVSDVSGPAFAVLARTARQTLGETAPLIVPFLTGPTDSRYWCKANARHVFRFTPFLYERDWMSRAHGTDERISAQTLADGVRFYLQLIRNADAL
jgi:carboxypeptidase PM20D1